MLFHFPDKEAEIPLPLSKKERYEKGRSSSIAAALKIIT